MVFEQGSTAGSEQEDEILLLGHQAGLMEAREEQALLATPRARKEQLRARAKAPRGCSPAYWEEMVGWGSVALHCRTLKMCQEQGQALGTPSVPSSLPLPPACLHGTTTQPLPCPPSPGL